ncbi:MAG: serine hydrolase domain-containing protein [Polyangiaceae bacterium]
MFRYGHIALVLCTTLQACSSTDSDSRDRDEATFPAMASTDLQHTLDDVVAAKVSPGVSVVVKRPGYSMWAGASGVANVLVGQSISTAQRFRAGSIMKVAVATAVLQLVERGKLSLDAPLTEVLPTQVTERIVDAGSITLRMLLNHTSGIPDFADEAFHAKVGQAPTHVWSLEEQLELAYAMQPTGEPGAAFSYSNTNYVLLGEVLHRSTGKPWRQVLRENVFARVGLTATSLPEPGNALCDGCARGYEPIDGALVDMTDVDASMGDASGGSGLITNPADLAKLIGALAEGKLFDDATTLDAMLGFIDAAIPEQAQTGYGLGLGRFQVGDAELIGHIGGTAGYQSFVFFQPASGAVVSGFMNCQGDFGAFVLPILDATARALSGNTKH